MQIHKNKVYVNRTLTFLLPCLSYYGDDFTKFIDKLFVCAVGFIDNESVDRGVLGFLVNKTISGKVLDRFLPEFEERGIVKNHKNHHLSENESEDDESRLEYYTLIEVRVPKNYIKSMSCFIEGRYSDMYTKSEIDRFFKGKKHSKTRAILNKDDTAKEEFIVKVNSLFGASIDDFNELKGIQFDLPPIISEEFFDYSDLNKGKFCREIIRELEKNKHETI